MTPTTTADKPLVRKIINTGGAPHVRLDDDLLRALDVKTGDYVTVRTVKDRDGMKIVIAPVR